MMKTTENIALTEGMDTSDIMNCYDTWKDYYPWAVPLPTPISYSFCTHTSEDKGLKALSIIKLLLNKKFIKIDSVERFIEIMDELVKTL